jgi:hypothetical protein
MTGAATADDRELPCDATTRALAMSSQTISVNANGAGGWEITPPLQADPITCGSLTEARRAAYRLATDLRPCEIVTFDAYNRVVYRKFIDTDEDAAAELGYYRARKVAL